MSDTEAKKHPASDRKIERQREEGSVPNVSEISNFTGAIIGLILLVGLAPLLFSRMAAMFSIVEARLNEPFDVTYLASVGEIGVYLTLILAPVVGGVVGVSILTALIYNKGVPFSLKPITPDFQRINPGQGLKRQFGMRTWVEVGVGLVRLTALFLLSGTGLWFILGDLFLLDTCGASCAANVALFVVTRLVFAALVLLIIFAMLEMLIQKRLFLHEQRMTDTEVKREQKEQVGSNEIRQERQRLRQEGAEASAHQVIDKANMCFFWGDSCIALRYHPEHAPSPRIIARAYRDADKTNLIRETVANNGFRELEHRSVVERLAKIPPGEEVPQGAYKTLVDAITKLFQVTT